MQIRLNKLVLEKLSFENLNIVKTCIIWNESWSSYWLAALVAWTWLRIREARRLPSLILLLALLWYYDVIALILWYYNTVTPLDIHTIFHHRLWIMMIRTTASEERPPATTITNTHHQWWQECRAAVITAVITWAQSPVLSLPSLHSTVEHSHHCTIPTPLFLWEKYIFCHFMI